MNQEFRLTWISRFTNNLLSIECRNWFELSGALSALTALDVYDVKIEII